MLQIFHYVLQWGDFSEIGIKSEYFADKIWLISSECVHLPTEQNSRISDIALTLSNEITENKLRKEQNVKSRGAY